jgi:RhoGAP domain
MRAPDLVISLSGNDADSAVPSSISSPLTPHSPGQPSPRHPSHDRADLSNPPQSPSLNIPLPASPKSRSPKSFFGNPIASRSATKLPKQESPSKSVGRGAQSSLAQFYGVPRAMGSSPELTASFNTESECDGCATDKLTATASSLNTDDTSKMSSSNHLMSPPDYLGIHTQQPKKKTSKHKFNILGRKSSLRDDDLAPSDARQKQAKSDRVRQVKDLRLDLAKDKSRIRNRSADRAVSRDETYQANGPHTSIPLHLKNTGSRAADGLGRAAKGLLGKLSNRTGTGDPRDSLERLKQTREEEAQKAALTKNYKIVNLPLEQQTRMTRICKRLEDCKDKTEFWLPAVAYRSIDYLNDKGMTHEGIYRVPGSEREIRNWIYRFDTGMFSLAASSLTLAEEDIDLLEEEDLYDVNAISSMFKAWLRDLPDEVFPKAIQHKITSSVGGYTENQGAPDILKTELSNLPPFNYYLLFAVTAHITMLLNSSKENKMTFHNLCVCFMPSMKMEMPCFSWLILDWKNCWKGCNSERDYLNREYKLLGDEAAAAEVARPVQHFDKYERYLPPGSRSGNDKASLAPSDAGSQVSSLYKASLQVDGPLSNGRNDAGRHGVEQLSKSLERRPVTSDSGQTRGTASGYSTPKKEKQKPVISDPISPLGANGNRSRSASTKDSSSLGFTAVKTKEKDGSTTLSYAPLELSPVQPLSPFGSLADH